MSTCDAGLEALESSFFLLEQAFEDVFCSLFEALVESFGVELDEGVRFGLVFEADITSSTR